LAARYRANAGTKSREKRNKTRKTNAVEQMIAFGAIAAGVAFLARHPIPFIQVVAGLLVVATGLYFLEHSGMWSPSKNQLASEARPPSKQISPMPSVTADARQDEHTVAKTRHDDNEASTSVKTPPQTRSIIPPRDAALDSWFIKSYLRCWTPPATLPPGENYAVQIRVIHNSDGSLTGAPLLVNPPSDPAWRPYADSAVRAVTKCNPLQVPPQYLAHFEQWRKMTLHFSPDSALE
jgi:hypothetical protein